MIGQFAGNVEAAVTVGVVLAEAIVLYAGYGAITRAAKGHVVDVIDN